MRSDVQQLVQSIWDFYDAKGRHGMPWRQSATDGTFDPYSIMVSEIMLQQTQVNRVWPKYEAFMAALPTIEALAMAPLERVLQLWNGLGYNRRAKYLWQAAQAVQQAGGTFPQERAALVLLPGIGPNTAGAIMAYAYDAPVLFIETNIRSVLIHHLFPEADKVSDAELLPIMAAMLEIVVHDTNPQHSPRTWYWALMDYGTYLKQHVGNSASRSHAYVRQSTFKGSRRQVRGQVLRILTAGPATHQMLKQVIADERLEDVLVALVREGMIRLSEDAYRLGGA